MLLGTSQGPALWELLLKIAASGLLCSLLPAHMVSDKLGKGGRRYTGKKSTKDWRKQRKKEMIERKRENMKWREGKEKTGKGRGKTGRRKSNPLADPTWLLAPAPDPLAPLVTALPQAPLHTPLPMMPRCTCLVPCPPLIHTSDPLVLLPWCDLAADRERG